MSDAPVTSSAPAPSPTPTQPQGGKASGNTPQASNSTPQAGIPTQGNPHEVFEVKVDGKIVKMSRQELIANASMAHASQSRFDEAAKTKKYIDSLVGKFKSNPMEALLDPSLGLTKNQIRDAMEAWYSKEFIEPETLTPHERESKAMREELARYKKAEADYTKQQAKEQEDKLVSQHREHLQKQITDTIESSGLPKTKFIAQRMAFYMKQNLMNGWEAPMELIANQVKKEHQEMTSGISESTDVEKLIEMLGEGVVKKIRMHDLQKLRESRASRSPSFSQKPHDENPNQKKRLTSSDVARNLTLMRQGKL